MYRKESLPECKYVCKPYAQPPQRSEEGISFPGTAVTDFHEPPCPLQEQRMLLTTELSLSFLFACGVLL